MEIRIEEDIMSEEEFNELIDNFEIVNTLTEYGRKAIKQNVKKLQKRIKELEEINTANRKVIVEQCDYIQNKSIPVQKVKDKIEELKKHYNTDNNIRIYTLKDSYELQATVLEELLEEK